MAEKLQEFSLQFWIIQKRYTVNKKGYRCYGLKQSWHNNNSTHSKVNGKIDRWP